MDSQFGSGTHFTAYLNRAGDPYVYYMDSYGTVPPIEIEKYLNTSGKQIMYNSTQYQKIDSVLCGYYCYYFLMEMHKGKSFYDVLSVLNMNNLNKNEEFIKKYFLQNQKGGSVDDKNNDNSGFNLGDLGSTLGTLAEEILPELPELLPLVLL